MKKRELQTERKLFNLLSQWWWWWMICHSCCQISYQECALAVWHCLTFSLFAGWCCIRFAALQFFFTQGQCWSEHGPRQSHNHFVLSILRSSSVSAFLFVFSPHFCLHRVHMFFIIAMVIWIYCIVIVTYVSLERMLARRCAELERWSQ